jgi:ribose/xylose/arabinose/galactoside ABC-type transport system permease subunit
VRFTVYALSGLLSAFAGVIYASQLLAASGTIGSDATLNSVAAVVLGGAALSGGTGGVPGTVLGVLILGTIADGMSLMHISPFYEQIATGLVLLAAVGLSQLQQALRGRRGT